MDFDLSEEQDMLQDTVRQLLQNECPPLRVRELFDGETDFDPALWKTMAEMGLMGLHLSEEYGGGGLELLDLALVSEMLGYCATPGPFLGHALASLAVELGGNDAQKERWLPRLAAGDAVGTIAFGEPDGGWQPDEWKLAAEAGLTGRKKHVPAAALADLLVIGVAGGGLALVEKNAEGLKVEPSSGVDRTRRMGDLVLESVPFEPLANGSELASRVRDAGLVLIAADAFGGASRCVELAVEYAKTREQFGVTIGHFQALKHQLANMAVEIEPARALYWYAAHSFDHIVDDSARASALAKAHLTDRFMQVSRDTVEAHGGIGYTWECDVQIWFKRALFDRAFLGCVSAHRERSAALAGW